MATRTALANRWYGLMDINAGTIANGDATIQGVGWEPFHFILAIACGRKRPSPIGGDYIMHWRYLIRLQ
ncbi:hypothetical protein SOASR029_23890 [Budvicia aquatica]|nr:hypothetical protein SOASR029_23890 [Budvicia aquatica]